MKSVDPNENTIIIKNSKFICLLYHVSTVKEVKPILQQVKMKYKDATHYCYAYIIDQYQKGNDDGEPAKTAGIPILQVLQKNNLNQVLCIVVRYFGKIKLGANGLVRAYTKSVVECLKDHIKTIEKSCEIELTFPYNQQNKIDHILKKSIVLTKQFNEVITYQAIVSTTILETLKQQPNITLIIKKDQNL